MNEARAKGPEGLQIKKPGGELTSRSGSKTSKWRSNFVARSEAEAGRHAK